MTKYYNLRKKLLINPRFQYSVMAYSIILFFIVIIILYASHNHFFNVFIDHAKEAGLADNHIYFKFLNEQKRIMNKVFFFSGITCFLVLFLGGLYISNKIAGPLYRLTNFLKAYQAHDKTPLQFRKGDYFIEVQDAVNEFIAKK
jgi:quinol-cytochrome oxidoreductase complex cytochrome b subunit